MVGRWVAPTLASSPSASALKDHVSPSRGPWWTLQRGWLQRRITSNHPLPCLNHPHGSIASCRVFLPRTHGGPRAAFSGHAQLPINPSTSRVSAGECEPPHAESPSRLGRSDPSVPAHVPRVYTASLLHHQLETVVWRVDKGEVLRAPSQFVEPRLASPSERRRGTPSHSWVWRHSTSARGGAR